MWKQIVSYIFFLDAWYIFGTRIPQLLWCAVLDKSKHWNRKVGPSTKLSSLVAPEVVFDSFWCSQWRQLRGRDDISVSLYQRCVYITIRSPGFTNCDTVFLYCIFNSNSNSNSKSLLYQQPSVPGGWAYCDKVNLTTELNYNLTIHDKLQYMIILSFQTTSLRNRSKLD